MTADSLWRLKDILDLYAEPDDPQRPVVCFDERPFQLLSDSQPPLPMKPGQPRRQDDEYRRQGQCTLFLCVHPLHGWQPVTVIQRRTSWDFIQQMKRHRLLSTGASPRPMLDARSIACPRNDRCGRVLGSQGEPPRQYCWERHDRLSAMAAIPLPSPCRQLRLSFHFYERSVEVRRFLRWIHRHAWCKLIMVMDRYSVHRKAVRLSREVGVAWLEVAQWPSCAPESNPVEIAWNHTKYAKSSWRISTTYDRP